MKLFKIKQEYLFILVATFVFLFRVAFFAAEYGGVEHDSGWFLGVAKNLAERGMYASYTNTIREDGIGAHLSLHGRYSVQDAEGYSYFPAGVTAGPGYVIPQAVLLSVFGNGFWQYRLWPLIGFATMLALLFYFSLILGGLAAVVVLFVWMWAVPQLYITFAFEGYGEHIALLYLLLSLYFLWLAIAKKRKNWLLFSSGIFLSLSILTKYLVSMTGPAFMLACVYDLYKSRKAVKKAVIRWGVFLLGVIVPIGLYELYRYTNLTSQFGIVGWEAINRDISLHFKINGSGVDIRNISWEFVAKKVSVWSKVGLNMSVVPWILLLLSPFVFLRKTIKEKKIFFIVIFTSSIPLNLWYLFMSPTGWTRHAWLGLVLSMVILSSLVVKFFKVKKRFRDLVLVVFALFIGWTVVKDGNFEPRILMGEKVINKWHNERYEGGLQGLPHTDIFSLADQRELVNFFENNIYQKDRVYYLGWFLVPEGSTLVDKVFYSLDRYFSLGQENPDGGQSYLILGPYQKGETSIVSLSYHDAKVKTLCRERVFENPSYTLCKLRSGLIYQNRAYE